MASNIVRDIVATVDEPPEAAIAAHPTIRQDRVAKRRRIIYSITNASASIGTIVPVGGVDHRQRATVDVRDAADDIRIIGICCAGCAMRWPSLPSSVKSSPTSIPP